MLLAVLLPMLAVAGFAQESRQDISVSGAGFIPPYAYGNGVLLHATVGYGGLLSYRYMLTPRSALELNYQYVQNVNHFLIPTNNILVHTRMQEISGAYVYNFIFKNFNPFLEAGVGGYIFTPIDDSKTNFQNSLSQNTNIGLLYGGGIAYEISPSFDIRAEYRGIVVKTPSFSFPNNDTRTNRYYNIYNPVIGVAYHF
ncbi:acyloxyacyl hydrolase [Paracidobacterium acidisoli]|uniref:acyloxyacyl hydrolase n=1 Tax=Paracidobacterium acidisoli TaxID=2303751 RepID=UPI0020796C69|nr:outer membrane beta-barrel protein [Paracidobacterium acidisoli]